MIDNAIPRHSGIALSFTFLTRWAQGIVHKQLQRLTWGSIILKEDQHETLVGSNIGPQVKVSVHRPSFYTALIRSGGVGAAESYMLGDWSCDNLTDLVRILSRNRAVLGDVEGGWARLSRPARRLFHWLNRNTHLGSRRNITAHYDLGNEFYKLFLDETMTYSAGVFTHPGATLAEASTEKYDRLCRKLALKAEDHVLEIGGGWGGFAQHAVERYGCRVTTTTISREQYNYMQDLFAEAGIADRITVLFEDYRDLQGQFDKLVSIEMIEAVGHDFQPTFLRKCADLLKPEGLMALQAITIADQHYAQHVRTVDFIKRYIFPGSCLTSVTNLCASATRVSNLRLNHMEDITEHYATTLRRWRENFMAKLGEVKAIGFDDSFIRMWDYYLCYCEGAFAERYIGNVQMVFAKPLNRQSAILMDQK